MSEVQVMGPLPPRPPTPPRATSKEQLQLQGPSTSMAPAADGPATPTSSAAPPVQPPTVNAQSVSKRVNFSPIPSYIKPAIFANNPKASTPLRNVTPSHECKPGKSILKTSGTPVMTNAAAAVPQPDSAAALLESALQELASDTRSSRIDAYIILARSWKAYANMPDGEALTQAVPSIARYIRRDVTAVADNFEPQNINIAHQALSLLLFLVWGQEGSSSFPEEAKSFVLDDAIANLQNPKIPKLLATDYLKILTYQRFAPKYLTPGRVSQLLIALHDLTDRVDGKAIVAQRILLYGTLSKQVFSLFVNQASLWIENVLTALFHPLDEIWKRAMSMALRVADEGPSTPVCKALKAMLDIPRDNGTKVLHTLCERLTSMAAKRDVHVPRIWSTVLLLLRSSRFRLDQWSDQRDWLLVLEKCFNSPEIAMRCEAFLAWDRLVYSLLPSETISEKTVGMLLRPILGQLDRRRPDKTVSEYAAHSYNILLYVAFHPSTSPAKLEYYWQEYVLRSFSKSLGRNAFTNPIACRTLASLLWNPQPKVWDERKVKDPTNKVKTSDLPRLDPKWVRSHISTVLSTFEALLPYSDWKAIEGSEIGIAWINLCKTLADASSKEITPSIDTMQALASVMGLLQRTWKSAPQSLNAWSGDADMFYTRFKFLYTTLASHLENSVLAERRLLKTSHETYQTASTPTHRHSSVNQSRTPSLHLIHMILSHRPVPPGRSYDDLFETILDLSVGARKSSIAQLEILRQIYEVLAEFATTRYQEHLDHASQALLNRTRRILLEQDSAESEETESSVFRILVSATKVGGSLAEWRPIFSRFVGDVKTRSGVETLLPFLETLSASALHHLKEELRSSGVVCCTELLRETGASNVLSAWGRSLGDENAPGRTSRLLEHLNNLTNQCLVEAYHNVASVTEVTIKEFMRALQNFLNNCPSHALPQTLETLQDGLALWLENNNVLSQAEHSNSKSTAFVRNLTARVSRLTRKVLLEDTSKLQSLSTIVSAGLQSSQPATSHDFVEMWNKIFGSLTSVEYPDSVARALTKLKSEKPRAHIKTPGLPDSIDVEPKKQEPSRTVRKEEAVTKTAKPISDAKTDNQADIDDSQVKHKDQERLQDDGQDQGFHTPEMRAIDSEFSSEYVPATTPQEALQSNGRPATEGKSGELKSVSKAFARLGDSVLGPLDGTLPWSPSMLSPGIGNDSDEPTSSPTPGSKASGQHSSNGQATGNAASLKAPPRLDLLSSKLPSYSPLSLTSTSTRQNGRSGLRRSQSPEKQVSQTEVVEETVLEPGRRSPSETNGDITLMSSSQPLPRDESTFLESSHVSARQPEDDTLRPSQSVSQTVDETTASVPSTNREELDDLVASQLSVDLEMSVDLESHIHPDMISSFPQTRKRKHESEDSELPPIEEKNVTDAQRPSKSKSQKRRRGGRSPTKQEPSAQSESTTTSTEQETTPRTSRVLRSTSQRTAKKEETESTPKSTTSSRQRKKQRRSKQATSKSSENEVAGEAGATEATPNPQQSHAVAGDEDTQMTGLEEGPTLPGNDAVISENTAALEEVRASETSKIVAQLKGILANVKSSSFDKSVFREIDDAMFEIKVAAHEAVERHQKDSSA